MNANRITFYYLLANLLTKQPTNEWKYSKMLMNSWRINADQQLLFVDCKGISFTVSTRKQYPVSHVLIARRCACIRRAQFQAMLRHPRPKKQAAALFWADQRNFLPAQLSCALRSCFAEGKKKKVRNPARRYQTCTNDLFFSSTAVWVGTEG